MLPIVLALVVASIISGGVTGRIHYFNPAMIIGPCIMAVGGGLFYTFTPETGSDKWIGYQVVFGFGLGCCMQGANLAVQAVLPADDVSQGVALMFFLQQLGGAVGTSVGQVIYANGLVSGFAGIGIPDVGGSAGEIIHAGAVELIAYVEAHFPQFLAAVIDVYNRALTRTLLSVMAFSLASLVSVFFLEWINLKEAEERGKREKMEEKERLRREAALKEETLAGEQKAPDA